MKKNRYYFYILLISLILLLMILILCFPAIKYMENVKVILSNEKVVKNSSLVINKTFTDEIKNSKKTVINGKTKKNPIIISIFGTDERRNERSRSDVIIVVKFSPQTKSAIIVSIPRDSRVIVPEKWTDKINSAYAYGGPALQKRTIENLLNIKIDYYVKINFYGFIKIIDNLGGVEVNSEKDFVMDNGEVFIRKGKQILNGEQALEYVRYRKDKDGDFGRIKRQQEVLVSIGKKILTPQNLIKAREILRTINSNIKTDIDFTQLINLFWEFRDISSIKIETYTLKTHSEIINGIWFEIIDEEYLEFLSKKLKSH